MKRVRSGAMSPEVQVGGVEPARELPRPHNPIQHISRTKVRDRVIAMVAEELGLEKGQVHPETILEADELDMDIVWMAIEEEFDVEIPEEVQHRAKTIQDIMHLVLLRL